MEILCTFDNMAVYTKADFARFLGRKNSYVTTNLAPDRQKLIANAEGKIDDAHPVNKLFIDKFFAKNPVPGGVKAAQVEAVKSKGRVNNKDTDFDFVAEENYDEPIIIPSGVIMELDESERLYKHNLALKTGKAKELDELKIEKLKGIVIPVAPIKTLVFQFKQGLLTKQKIAFDAMLNEIKHKYDITSEDMAEYKSFSVRAINAAELEATDDFIRGMDKAVMEFSVKKTVGENG